MLSDRALYELKLYLKFRYGFPLHDDLSNALASFCEQLYSVSRSCYYLRGSRMLLFRIRFK